MCWASFECVLCHLPGPLCVALLCVSLHSVSWLFWLGCQYLKKVEIRATKVPRHNKGASASASDWLARIVSKMTCDLLIGMLNPTHWFVYSKELPVSDEKELGIESNQSICSSHIGTLQLGLIKDQRVCLNTADHHRSTADHFLDTADDRRSLQIIKP